MFKLHFAETQARTVLKKSTKYDTIRISENIF